MGLRAPSLDNDRREEVYILDCIHATVQHTSIFTAQASPHPSARQRLARRNHLDRQHFASSSNKNFLGLMSTLEKDARGERTYRPA